MDYHLYSGLLNRIYIAGFQDCYTVVRDFYSQNYEITLPNYARPDNFQDEDFNLIGMLKNNPDFLSKPANRNLLVAGDVLTFRVASNVENHFGVYVGNGLFIHHLINTRSKEDSLDNKWMRRVISVLRHKEAPEKAQSEELFNLIAPMFRNGGVV